MLPTVDLNDEPCVGAEEVRDIAMPWNLPPEFESEQPAIANRVPQRGFSVRRTRSQIAREIGEFHPHAGASRCGTPR
jgi:hypothetical protein